MSEFEQDIFSVSDLGNNPFQKKVQEEWVFHDYFGNGIIMKKGNKYKLVEEGMEDFIYEIPTE